MKALDHVMQSVLAEAADVLDAPDQAEREPVNDFREQQLFQSLDVDK